MMLKLSGQNNKQAKKSLSVRDTQWSIFVGNDTKPQVCFKILGVGVEQRDGQSRSDRKGRWLKEEGVQGEGRVLVQFSLFSGCV